MASLGTASAGSATAARLLMGAVAPATAYKYGRRWAAYEDFCRANGWPALPTPAAAVACYFGTLVEWRLAPSSLQSYLTPIKNRHADAGYSRPAIGKLITQLRAGNHRLLADEEGAFPFARAPLPGPVLWRVAKLAAAEADPSWAARYPAVVLQFVLVRRTAEILSLRLTDVSFPATGGADVQVVRFKGGERRAKLQFI